jgi:hypothetical protein
MHKLLLGLSLLAVTTVMADDEIAAASRRDMWGNEKKKEEAPRPYYYSEDESEFFAYADWIYWNATANDPMLFATKTERETVLASPQVATTRTKNQILNYGFRPGFRVGTGYRLGRNKVQNDIRPWQVEAEYTRLHTNTDRMTSAFGDRSTKTVLDTQQITSSLANAADHTVGKSAHSRSQLNYDRVDLKFAWPIWITPTVLMRLMTGGTAAWFNNDWKTRFTAFDYFLQTSAFKWKWWGGGLMAATDIYMGVGSGFGFFADTSFALLCGPMKLKTDLFGQSNRRKVYVKKKDHYNQFQPTVTGGAGIDYKHWFAKKTMLQLSLGWEFTWWYGINPFDKMTTFSEDLTFETTDIAYHGLTARVGFEY